MDKRSRKDLVICMDKLARCVNNEEFLYDVWLSCGVADGDVDAYTKPDDENLDYYTDDKTFSELMTTFLQLMSAAWKDGGLYHDRVSSLDRNEAKELFNYE